MKDGLYQFIVGMLDLFLWSGEMIGEENLPRRGPAVFIANHLDATPGSSAI
jgi:1-acyl-sn-glycerol-3-phosphate acyltransferase